MGAPLESEVDDAPDHLIVAETGGASGAGESAGVFRQIAVGVDVDDVRRAVGGQPDVEAAVVAQLHRGERGRARPVAMRASTSSGSAGAAAPASCRGTRARSPPTSPSNETMRGLPGGHLREVDLVQRQQVDRRRPRRPSIDT